jgi:hypothetical protein
MIKTLSKLGIEGNFSQIDRGHLKKSTTNLVLNIEKLDAFFLMLWKLRSDCSEVTRYKITDKSLLLS